jgi:uncharacterized protein with FMN-binding domain
MAKIKYLPLAIFLSIACVYYHNYQYPFLNPKESGQLRDGVYSGSVYEKDDRASVEVTITKGLISEVKIIDVYAYGWREAAIKAQLPGKIIKAQSPVVDAITGATGSTNAVKIATDRALRKARK